MNDINDILKNVKIISPNDQIWQRVEEIENIIHIQGQRIADLENKIKEIQNNS